MDLGDKNIITNPTLYWIGKAIVCLGIVAINFGIVTYITGDFIVPPSGWGVLGLVIIVTGVIIGSCGIRRNRR